MMAAEVTAEVGECRVLEDLQGLPLRYVDLDYEVEALAEQVGVGAGQASAFVVAADDAELG